MKYRVLVSLDQLTYNKLQKEPFAPRRYRSALSIVKGIAKARPDVHFYVLVRGRTNKDYDGLDHHQDPDLPNVSMVFCKIPAIAWCSAPQIGPPLYPMRLIEQFNQEIGIYPIHAFISMETPCVFETAWSLSSHKRKIPGYFYYQNQGHEDHGRLEAAFILASDEHKHRDLLAVRDTRSATARCVFMSEQQLELFSRRIKQAVKPSVFTRWLKDTVIQYPIPDQTMLDSADKAKPWATRTVELAYFGRVDPVKNPKFVDAIYRAMYASAEFSRGVITTPEDEAPDSELFDYLEVMTDVRRSHFMDVAGNTKVTLLASLGEGFGMAILESLIHGVVPVLPNLNWARLFLDPKVYPFFYDPWDKDMARAKVREALAEGGRWSPMVQAEVRKKFCTGATPLVDDVLRLAKEGSDVIQDPAAAIGRYEAVERAKAIFADHGNSMPFSEFMISARKGAIAKGFMGRPLLDVGEWYAVLQALGYQDRGGFDPVLSKE